MHELVAELGFMHHGLFTLWCGAIHNLSAVRCGRLHLACCIASYFILMVLTGCISRTLIIGGTTAIVVTFTQAKYAQRNVAIVTMSSVVTRTALQ